jgi:O-antigen ligase
MNKNMKGFGAFIIIAALLITFIPQSNTMDVMGLQWLLLGIINIVGIIFIWIKKKMNIKKRPLTVILLLFVSLAGLSTLYASNTTLAIQDLSRWINVLAFAYLSSVMIKEKILTIRITVNVMSFLLLIEVIVILIPLFQELYTNGLQILKASSINSGAFNGITGNKNIAAASIMVKLPFVMYYIKEGVWLKKIIGCIIIIFTILSVLFISARASYISFAIFSISFIIAGAVYIKKDRLKFFGPILFSYLVGFGLGNVFVPNASKTGLANKISSISFTQEGSSGRTLLWNDALSYTLEHPFLGGGLGSWKIESAPYWNAHGDHYLIPYHAHNDFFEIAAELGIAGGALYLSIFTYLAYLLFTRFSNSTSENGLFYFICFVSLCTYGIDSIFNFPMERPIMQLSFAILLAIGMNIDNHKS